MLHRRNRRQDIRGYTRTYQADTPRRDSGTACLPPRTDGELAAELRFEEAQELKEKYRLLENYRSKSVIVSQTVSDVDVFGFDDDGSNDVYVKLHARSARRRRTKRHTAIQRRSMTKATTDAGIRHGGNPPERRRRIRRSDCGRAQK